MTHDTKRAFLSGSWKGNVLVMGAGRSGQSAISLLLRQGANPKCVDENLEGARSALHEAGLSEVEVVLPKESDLVECRALILSPGVPRTHRFVRAAVKMGIPIANEIELAASLLSNTRFIGVTGSNGKSTTVSMLGVLLEPFFSAVFVGGNLGRPLCEAVVAGEQPEVCVLELSSFQLETIDTLRFDVALITNLAPDHLDRYDSVDSYYAAKAQLLRMVTRDGVICLNANDADSVKYLQDEVSHDVGHFHFNTSAGQNGVEVTADGISVCRDGEAVTVRLEGPARRGEHNRQNAAAAAAAAVSMGTGLAALESSFAEYGGLEHRLEDVGRVDGVLFVNDSKATNVDATIRAIESFHEPVHLILGGRGKGASYKPLVDACQSRAVRVYTVGEDAENIRSAFSSTEVSVQATTTLENAVEAVAANAVRGEVALLSPACSSYDQFRNYIVRGEFFRSLVAELQNGGAE